MENQRVFSFCTSLEFFKEFIFLNGFVVCTMKHYQINPIKLLQQINQKIVQKN